MDNLILFFNAFMSYFILFIVSVALIIGGVLVGIRLRKLKDKKESEQVVEK